MTLVPEGKVWNYGIGLTQLWAPSLQYNITLDTPLLFWAEQHRPAAFLTVSELIHCNLPMLSTFRSLLIWRPAMIVRTLKIALPKLLVLFIAFESSLVMAVLY